ncbi:N-glycosyltransferase [Bacillus sp. THAF10]|uniref:bifunctional glycosyltransferase family 2/GtrA family protein n=1 Tax=Bacillus sp. THAF10 TaxID=2587848 RepID=UPI00126912EC|nr:bifunctional glycosyltransferase family 2/GtrA family protein [Bacillus sp. THAF10]QFT90749.1 N-glycosyltransferase [Bacillus sp. THAF10]
MHSLSSVGVLIPAYNPDGKLPELVNSIVKEGFDRIIVVNDGSNSECDQIFSSLTNISECTILKHEVNKGKGQALKTAFAYFLDTFADSPGLVTVDADGQHAVKDMKKVAKRLCERPESLVLGVRDFSGEDIPFRSRFGNVLTKGVARFACGLKISDTQTGLRGIPVRFLEKLLHVGGQRYEFEMNMLLECKANDIDIEEVTIETIYIEENKSSHFNPIIDSIKIYSVFLKFAVSSALSFGLDVLLFALFVMLLNGVFVDTYIIYATILARVLSALFNFMVNRNVVFKSASPRAMVKYFILAVGQMLTSAAAVYLIFQLIGFGEVGIKVIVDFLLFLMSFVIQREWVFKRQQIKIGETQ